MKNILTISLLVFNFIVIILILINIKNNKKEFFNTLRTFESYLGEHFQENTKNGKIIKCKEQKDKLMNCYKNNKCTNHELNMANINLDNCLENK